MNGADLVACCPHPIQQRLQKQFAPTRNNESEFYPFDPALRAGLRVEPLDRIGAKP